MQTGWQYRGVAVLGSTLLVTAAVALANTPPIQLLLTAVPPLNNLQSTTLTNDDLLDQAAITVTITLVILWPLYKPRPRRILDTISLTQRRLFLTAAVLATIGYFDWSSRLPRTTLVGTVLLLGVALPLWFVSIRRQPNNSERAIIVGDNTELIERLYASVGMPILGLVAPSSVLAVEKQRHIADGGVTIDHSAGISHLGGLSRLDDVLIEHDIDTVLLAFEEPDRREFFGALSTCFEHGIQAKVHRDHADSVLVANATGGELVDTNIEPWDWQDYVVKRAFDIAFSVTGFICLTPVVALITVAVKLDSPGPLLYSQTRTAAFGETFTVYKFRSMVTDAESETGATISREDTGGTDPRVTRVGRILRRTHLDEIPQLWAVLTGDMSVVGPRPERPEIDTDIEANVDEWRSRWFVKPGLTGMAQINGVTGSQPAQKVRYDIQYIRKRSFWFDTKIVLRQLYNVFQDTVELVRRSP
ncbi:sugar transferase [Haloarcula laminariae]|uniref:sugar transferase n=1 Tax=Haloarcula laminariae TaxID=2961577 RepID=UPI0021C757AD|nr:exopolysaccharide biosynthesis polyprenyl glycosylphosphotransferase [Halomicroarcula laminariae]